MKTIVRVKDITKGMNVSKSTACRMIKKVVKFYGLDVERLPVQGCCPEDLFNEYFQLNIKGNKNESNKKA